MPRKPEDPIAIAEFWEAWCGKTPWSEGLRELAKLGGEITYWCGVPRSASAIPLTFVVHSPCGAEFDGSRLKDIRSAVAAAKQYQAA